MFENIESMIQAIDNGNMANSSSLAIGIDLGTKNCCVAVYECEKKDVTIIPNSLRKNTTPSYVYFEESGNFSVGQAVKRQGYKHPEYTIFDSKRMIGRLMESTELKKGRQLWQFKIESSTENTPEILGRNQKRYAPEDISAMLIENCIDIAQKYLRREISSAVITVPAYFNDNQKKATIQAGKKAGLKVLRLLNEPTAAAIAYRIKKIYEHRKRVLIFDLGGGTFDVAVVDIDENTISVLAIGGDTFLGGEDFDTKVLDFCLRKFKEKHGVDLKDKSVNKHVARSLSIIREVCEANKIDLDVVESVQIDAGNIFDNLDLEVTLTRQDYENLTEPLITEMLKITEDTLNSKGIRRSEIEDVIMVGASTRAPGLQARLKQFFGGINLNFQINPDEAVAYGAAVYAAYLNDPLELETEFDVRAIHDVVPMSIGIKANIGGEKNRFDRIIEKNTRYPFEARSKYCTEVDNQQKVLIHVYQGEDRMVANNILLGKFELSEIPKAKAGKQWVCVIMRLDENGILRVTAQSETTGGTAELVVRNIGEKWKSG